jgi:predicted Zn-dependent protease
MKKVIKSLQSVLALVMAVGLAGLAGCETNPYTGRSQLLMTSVDQEMQMGAQAYGQVKNDPKMHQSQDTREIEPVRRVAARIIEAAKRSKYAEMANQFQWEVTVIKDDKTMNAFALPGGKIAVYTGIFPVAKTEAGLAAVLGHEVTHALARHGAERMSQGQLTNAALQVLGTAAGAAGGNAMLEKAAMAALGAGAQVGVLLLMRGTIPASRFICGSEWNRCPVVRGQRSSCRPIQVMKRGLNNSRNGCRRLWRSTKPSRPCQPASCLFFARRSIHGLCLKPPVSSFIVL